MNRRSFLQALTALCGASVVLGGEKEKTDAEYEQEMNAILAVEFPDANPRYASILRFTSKHYDPSPFDCVIVMVDSLSEIANYNKGAESPMVAFRRGLARIKAMRMNPIYLK